MGIDLDSSLRRFSRHGDDLMDRWDGSSFRRPYRIGTRVGAVGLRPDPGGTALEVETDSKEMAPGLAPLLASMFVDERQALSELCARDPVIAELSLTHPGLWPVRALDPLAALLSLVTSQQVNLAVALSFRRAILVRLGRRIEVGGDFVMAPDPERLAQASAEDWSAIRLSRSKARCLAALGQAVAGGELDFADLALAPDEEVRLRLLALPGLGPWSASQYLTRVLGRPVIVADDLGVRKAVQLAYQLPLIPTAAEVTQLTAHYGSAAFSAQQLLLLNLAGTAAAPAPSLGPGPLLG
ncbi:MAG TPA: hypothetical protein VI138_06735 [Candidatus Dormibacteraeota bacterium]